WRRARSPSPDRTDPSETSDLRGLRCRMRGSLGERCSRMFVVRLVEGLTLGFLVVKRIVFLGDAFAHLAIRHAIPWLGTCGIEVENGVRHSEPGPHSMEPIMFAIHILGV